ncbi:MAG: amidohydrolase family protein [Balneolaceae bacterium]|nr:amidohydrolase family protein [Balneolaceae bacterium]
MKLARSLIFCMAIMVIGHVAKAQSSPAQAFDNVTIHIADGQTIESGTIVWRNGVIESVGSNVNIPFDAYTIDGGDSLHVYPGFVDGMALWGSPDLPDRYEEPDRPGEPGYERAGVQPQRKPSELLKTDDKALTEAQKSGFTTAALGLKGQMLPGQVDLFFINGKETDEYLMQSGVGMLASLENAPGGFGSGAYPSTRMGVLAEYRQLWYDATALQDHIAYFASASSDYPAPKKNEVLEALFPVLNGDQPLYFIADTKQDIEVVLDLQDNLGFEMVLVSGKEAYTLADELKNREIPVLASIDLPEKPKWKVEQEKAEKDTTEEVKEIEEITEEMRVFRERQLEAYKADIENIQKLIDAGVKVGYASNGMKISDFSKHLNTLAEETGLDESQLLSMITQNTAEILKVGSRVGDITDGRIASFSVFSDTFLTDEVKVMYSVSAGELTEIE